MRKKQKQIIIDLIETISEAHKAIKKYIDDKKIENAKTLIADCQDTVSNIMANIEKTEKNAEITLNLFEEYYKALYNTYENISLDIKGNEVYRTLNEQIIAAKKSFEKNIKVRLEIVFMPYNVSMWDSLESIWKAADADPDCNAYVVPIPYYDRNPDLSFGKYHYEGKMYPDYVPVIDYRTYNLKHHQPDVVYIHNPYDECNYVTSVAPEFYSYNIKKYTETLVYVPYYATSGGMSEEQYSYSAYYHADYIVIQAPKYRAFFDKNIPDEKFLAFGSPKFDKVINMCKNPPEIPENWKKRISGRRVIFYNTSLNGMLGNTQGFFRKMNYVFDCFKERDDFVLLWRPHPLFESTILSMRPQYIEEFNKIKKRFFDENLGIYDDTPEIESTIAICDAYIGDGGTSVTSLFGVAGKPVFVLNNLIDKLPTDDDIYLGLGSINKVSSYILWNNSIYSNNNDFEYKYITDIMGISSKYMSDMNYLYGEEINGKLYLCPFSEQSIGIIENNKLKKVNLIHKSERSFNFARMLNYDKYIILLPFNYPALVCYNIISGKIDYFEEHIEKFIGYCQENKINGGYCLYNNMLLLASPEENIVIAVDIIYGKTQLVTINSVNKCGCAAMYNDGENIWLMPSNGIVITKWNPVTGEVHEYSNYPEAFRCIKTDTGKISENMPFKSAVSYDRYIIFAPWQANMFIMIDKVSGEINEWTPPFILPEKPINSYHYSGGKSHFFEHENINDDIILYSEFDAVIYRFKFGSNKYEKIVPKLENYKIITGFGIQNKEFQYGCCESVFNSLNDFLDNNIHGEQFDKEKQIQAYSEIAANYDGTCGEKTHKFISDKLK